MVSTTDKVVDKTTKIPGPSPKHLPQRSSDNDMTYEENKAISDAQVKAFFAPKKPEAKQTYSEKDKKWAIDMLTQLAQYKMNLPSDYDCKILKQGALSDEKKKTSAKSGKRIPQLGEQKNESVSPLIVGSDIDKAFQTNMDMEYDLLDPIII
jgi:hypothetical protein